MHFFDDFEEFVVEIADIIGVDLVLEMVDAVEDGLAVGIFGEFFVFEINLILEFVDGATGGDVVPDGGGGLFGREGDFLRKVAKAEFGEVEGAGVGGLLAEDEAEKGGLSGAVDADDADFAAGFDLKAAVVVDDLGSKSER